MVGTTTNRMGQGATDMSASPGQPSRHHILLVEDHPEDAILFREAIRKEPWDLTVAASAAEGIRQARTERFDAAVIDYNLGDRTGTEVLLALRNDGVRFPILLYTGMDAGFVMARAYALGAAGFIDKDESDFQSLVVTKVRDALRRGRLQHAVTRHSAFGEREPGPAIDRFVDELKDSADSMFTGVGFATTTGFLVSSRMPVVGPMGEEAVSAMASALVGTAVHLSHGLIGNATDVVCIHTNEGGLLCAPVGDFGVLYALCASVDDARVRERFRLAAHELNILLETITARSRS
jgi:CheY-like chemotaxis protein/predicted regulator of Ras-like GTPase activity (Roadblock/LC7/MglB family)